MTYTRPWGVNGMETKMVVRDGIPIVEAKCPHCGGWADIDDDQLVSRVSVICPVCEWHGYVKDE